jgi:hypothetical protein
MQIGSTNSSGIATFSFRSNRGTYTLKVTNITKTGYTFDAVNALCVLARGKLCLSLPES